VRGRSVPALDRVDESPGAPPPLRGAGAAPGGGAEDVSEAEGPAELAVPIEQGEGIVSATLRSRRIPARTARRRSEIPAPTIPGVAAAALPDGWREFVGGWLKQAGCAVQPAARGDWEIELSAALQ